MRKSRYLLNVRDAVAILYEDPSCLVIDKPAGVSVAELQSTGSLAHRLDKGTTGCLLIAKTEEALESLRAQFKDRSVKKTYLAIVAGAPSEPEATIDAPIGRSLGKRTTMAVFRAGKTRNATTAYVVVSAGPEAALLRCEPETGRTHQIRVHLKSIGHPILGDGTYGTRTSRDLSGKYGITSPMLHAWKLTFTSPATGERVLAESPAPEGLAMVAERMNLILPT